MIPIHSIQGDGIGKSILDGLNPIHSIQGDGIGKSILDDFNPLDPGMGSGRVSWIAR
jgi:hypothetical protein